MKNTKIFQNALANIPEDVKIQVDLSMGIADRIAYILKTKGLSQKDFAKMMGKTEAEVSRWVGGTHNFTLTTIAKISAALGASIINVDKGYVLPEQEKNLMAEDIKMN